MDVVQFPRTDKYILFAGWEVHIGKNYSDQAPTLSLQITYLFYPRGYSNESCNLIISLHITMPVENPDYSKNQSDCRIHYIALLGKNKLRVSYYTFLSSLMKKSLSLSGFTVDIFFRFNSGWCFDKSKSQISTQDKQDKIIFEIRGRGTLRQTG